MSDPPPIPPGAPIPVEPSNEPLSVIRHSFHLAEARISGIIDSVYPQAAIPGCPPGLEYLTKVDQLFVKQKVELLEVITGFETANWYDIVNKSNQPVYTAAEDSGCCVRNCCGAGRPFEMQILDNFKKEVIHVNRPLRCRTTLCPCCRQEVIVEAPKGTVIGHVQQMFSLFSPLFKVTNAQEETILLISGPCCRKTMCKCCTLKFSITAPNNDAELGVISKEWSGLAKELFTDADNYGVSFPMDMDVKAKATLLGAVFLINFLYFEKTGKERRGKA